MTAHIDLSPAAQQMRQVVAGIKDSDLSARTPCEHYVVGDLVDHVYGLTLAFRAAAGKASLPGVDLGAAPRPSAANLALDWRAAIPRQLDDLVTAWRGPSAWQGMTQVGGVTLPGEVAGIVGLDELVLHGWDLAKATEQSFACDPEAAEVLLSFTEHSALPEQASGREGIFGAVVPVPVDAPVFDRVLGFAGRRPDWSA